MSLTIAVVNRNYAHYLRQCLDSVCGVADEVLFYDDASDDESVEIARSYGVTVTVNDAPSGGPVWGSNASIRDCATTHLAWVDSDNFVLRKPLEHDTDYTFFNLFLCDEHSSIHGRWDYDSWPTTYPGVFEKFKRDAQMPFPWGGVWRTDFLRGREWRYFDGVTAAPDFRTAIDWMHDEPSLTFDPTPWLVFRQHAGQMSDTPERAEFQRQAREIADAM